ncbi:cytochrome c oxidase subunit 2 [Tanacetum coccineum]
MIVLEWLFLTIAPCDAAEPWQLGSQDAATPMMQGIIDLHHDIFFFLILILVFVSRILVRALWHFQKEKNPIPQRIVHGTTIEILRTIFPSIIPMFIAIPSFALFLAPLPPFLGPTDASPAQMVRMLMSIYTGQ